MERTFATEAPALDRIRGFAFDLDGTIWAGPTLLPGAAELVGELRAAGVPVVFVSNSSRQGAAVLARRLCDLGITAGEDEVAAAFDLVADEILRRLGRVRVMPLGTRDLSELLESAGHEVVPFEDWTRADAVVVGNDPAFDFARLRSASRAVAAGAAFFAVNLDARFPVALDHFDPGCGALAEAVAVASGVRPVAVGKPELPLFRLAIDRLRCGPSEAAMVGDNLPSDITGGRAAGMFTVWLDGRSGVPPREADLRVSSLVELRSLWNARGGRGAVQRGEAADRI
ncbi:MAG: HAD-IIA family hydrolase [Isosphaeraceae bacterium]